MKKTMNFLAVLLVAMGTSTVAFAGEKVKADSQVKVISFDKSDSYKLIYKHSGKQTVLISLMDEKGNAVHRDAAHVEGGFAQDFDLSLLPTGIYTFEVSSKGEKVAQAVSHVSDADQLAQSMALTSNAESKKIVLRSSALLSAPFSVAVYGAENELLFSEDLKAEALTKVYNLSEVKGSGVRFTVSYGNSVVKDQKFDF